MNSDVADVERAVAAGMPAPDALLLAALRQRWWRQHEEGAATTDVPEACWPDVERALRHPSAASLDELFVAALRRERGLVCPSPVVRSEP